MHFSPARKDPWLNNHSNGSCWDGGPRSTCNPSSIATPIKCPRKYASKPQTVSDGCHPRLGRLLRPQDLPAENVVQRIFAWMAADRTTSATHKRLLTPVHLLLGDHLIDARHLLRLGDHNGANDDDPAFEASFFACYQARPATEGNLSAVTVLDLLQKRTVHFCSRYNTVTGTSAPLTLPSSSCTFFANRAPPSSRSRPDCVPHPPDVRCRSRLASRQRHSEPLPRPLRCAGPGPCPNYGCTSCSTRSKSISPLRLGMSSMSTSPLVAFPTSAVYNRTWMPTFGL